MSKIKVEIDYILMAQYMNNLTFCFREIKKLTRDEKIINNADKGEQYLLKMCDVLDRAIDKDILKQMGRDR